MEEKSMEVEYVWRQRDVRSLRRALWVRNQRVQAAAAALVVSAALGVLLGTAFFVITAVTGAMLLFSALRLILPWRPLTFEPEVLMRLEDDGVRTVRTQGGSRAETLLAWKDIGGVRELPRQIVFVGGHERIGDGYVPRRAFDGRPEVLAELRRRVDAARLGTRIPSAS
jgi:hypothetical protein